MKKCTINVLGLIIAGTLTLGGISACGDSGAPAAESSKIENDTNEIDETKGEENQSSLKNTNAIKDAIIIATANEPPSVHTANHNAVAGNYMNQLTHAQLFDYTIELEVVPRLVEEFEILNDTQWQFKLKEGILFHNGDEMKSEDVQATFIWNKQWPDREQYTKSIESVEIIDDYNFIINTNGIQATLLYDLAHFGNAIVPKSLVDEGNDFSENPIGSGPYKYVKWIRGDRIEFELFEDYYDEDTMPTIKDMTWLFIPEGSSRTIGLENGEIDMIIEVATTDIPRLEQSDATEVLMVPGTTHNYIMINNEKEPFNNVLLRKAMSAAIDKEAVIEVAQDGYASLSFSATPSVLAGASDEHIIAYDVELAKQLLEESGVDPNSFVFNIITSDEAKKRAAEVIQANLLELGITTEITQMDLSTYLDVTTTTDFTAAIGGFTQSEMTAYAKGVLHSSSIGASNRSRVNSPQLDALIDKALVTFDIDERISILEETSALANDLLPSIPLYHSNQIRAYDARLGGVTLSPFGRMPLELIYWKDNQ